MFPPNTGLVVIIVSPPDRGGFIIEEKLLRLNHHN